MKAVRDAAGWRSDGLFVGGLSDYVGEINSYIYIPSSRKQRKNGIELP